MAVVLKTDNLKASILKEDYEEFVRWAWHLVVPETCEWNWHMSIICQRMQEVVDRCIARLPAAYDEVINICPGSSKSLLTSVMLPAWTWTKDPSIKFICGSFALDLAQNLSRLCRNIIRSPEYQKLFPYVEISHDQDTKTYFANTAMGFRYAVGVGGNVLGRHADVILLDDPIDPKIAASEVELDTSNRWIKEQISGRKTSKVTTVTILIMQRLAQNDPAGIMMESKRCRKLIIPATDEYLIHPPQLIKYYKKGLMDPNRIPRSFLDTIKQESDYVYAGQYCQQPVPPGGSMFKTDRFRKDAPFPVCTRFCRAWDKAGSTGKRSAFTVGLLMGVDDHNRFTILDVIRTKLDSYSRDKLILETAKSDGYDVMIALEQEGGSGGKQSHDISLQQLAGFHIIPFKPQTAKSERADPYSSQVNGGNVWLHPSFWNSKLIEEHKFFPFGTYKDQVDAATMAFKALTGTVNIRIGGWTPSETYMPKDNEINSPKPFVLDLNAVESRSTEIIRVRFVDKMTPFQLPERKDLKISYVNQL